MTVAELIAYLQQLPQESIVLLSRDSEGNGYSPISGSHSEGAYEAETTWSGEFHYKPTNDDDSTYDEERENWKTYDYGSLPRCVVLYPTA